MEIVGTNGTVAIDFQTKQATMLEFGETKERLLKRELPTQENNAILAEQREFAAAIRGEGAVTVSGEAGYAALAVAEQILAEIASNRHIASQSQRRLALQQELQRCQSLVRKAA
jgi:predicted dehydrogenase